MREGIVVFWNDLRGYGFIGVSRSEKYFFHISKVSEGPLGDLRGFKCRFDVEPSKDPKRLHMAVNVVIEDSVANGAVALSHAQPAEGAGQ